MKRLTYSAMAAARLRGNKKQYISLILGIFLSVFMVTSLVLCVYGIYLAFLQDRGDKVGLVDMVLLDNDTLRRADLEERDIFSHIGTVTVSGEVADRNVYLGYYDAVGQELMQLRAQEGRLPETPDELAVEKSAMDVLEVSWTLGQTVELAVTPLDGLEETREFTLVGFLPEQTAYFSISDYDGLQEFPALVTCAQEPGFKVGRVGVHHVMKLRSGVSINDGLRSFSDSTGFAHYYDCVYALTITCQQQQVASMGTTLDANMEIFTLILMACSLGGALLLSCGVGISSAMEGLLSGRREEIGVLRALGATRRQIRRIFGRENLLLALIVAPLSIAVGCLAVWCLSLLLPERLVFGFHIMLVLPIGAFSVTVVLLSGYLPLSRASRLMPMSVIRDTAMLRRNKKVRTKKLFSPTRLIASRQVRFNPRRQLGAAMLVGLMLLCAGLFVYLSVSLTRITVTDHPGFVLQTNQSIGGADRVYSYDFSTMSSRSIAQMRNLSNVKKLVLDREMYIELLVDRVPRYAVMDGAGFNINLGMLDDDLFQEALEISPSAEYMSAVREEAQEKYRDFLQTYGIPNHAFQAVLATVDLDEKIVDKMNAALQGGKIDIDAINRGEQVIVMAPDIWIKPLQNGYRTWFDEKSVNQDPNGAGAVKAAWNDAFVPGQTLPMMQLYREVEGGPVIRRDESVTVGAVIGYMGELYSHFSEVEVLTTEQGLNNMALRAEGLHNISVYVDGDMTLEEEQRLESQLTAIARRTDDFKVVNYMEGQRENEQSSRQTILLFSAVTVLFFAVAVGMIVSSVTRQLNSEERTIGMLRAVGADEKAILGCYSGQITASVVGGLAITLVLLAVWAAVYVLFLMYDGFRPSMQEAGRYMLIAVTSGIMALSCWLVCRATLRLRIRRIISKSIIENIREL